MTYVGLTWRALGSSAIKWACPAMQSGTQLKQLKENKDILVVILVHIFLDRKPEQETVVGVP
jgi:hypothetical protein